MSSRRSWRSSAGHAGRHPRGGGRPRGPGAPGASPALAKVLGEWTGRWYWADPEKSRLVLIRALPGASRPRWWLHVLLFLITIVCALGAGAALAGVWFPFVPPGLSGEFIAAGTFLSGVVKGDWRVLLEG